jgi:hypothetical protein
MSMSELWKDVPGYEGIYMVSDIGNVKSLKYNKERLLSFGKTEKGYLFCILRKENKRKNIKVHQLVAMAFFNHTPCGMKKVVDHINNDKTDNRLVNIRLVSSRDNFYRVKQGLNTGNHKGVYRQGNKWRAQLSIKKKRIHIGMYDNEQDAVDAYNSCLLSP